MLRSQPAIRPVTDAEEEQAASPDSPVDARDGVAVVGLAALVWGVWQIYSPAGWIVLGAALLVIAWRA